MTYSDETLLSYYYDLYEWLGTTPASLLRLIEGTTPQATTFTYLDAMASFKKNNKQRRKTIVREFFRKKKNKCQYRVCTCGEHR